jgi:hypothetical protein
MSALPDLLAVAETKHELAFAFGSGIVAVMGVLRSAITVAGVACRPRSQSIE